MKLNGATQLALSSFKGQHKEGGLKLVNVANFCIKSRQSWILLRTQWFLITSHLWTNTLTNSLLMNWFGPDFLPLILSSLKSHPPSVRLSIPSSPFLPSLPVPLFPCLFRSLPHPPPESVLSGWAGFMSEVIKRRGDEGQRWKERWRTEGDAGGKKG